MLRVDLHKSWHFSLVQKGVIFDGNEIQCLFVSLAAVCTCSNGFISEFQMLQSKACTLFLANPSSHFK